VLKQEDVRRAASWLTGPLLCFVVCLSLRLDACAQSVSRLDMSGLRGTGASALVLAVDSGRVLAQTGDVDAGAAPGSAVKPFVLRAALESGVVTERTTMHCDGTLRVAGRNLACVHPRDVTVLDARQALAESCNTYFAAVARRMTARQMVSALRGAGFQVQGVPPETDARVLMGLGLEGVRVSVRQMAEAYRGLAVWVAGGDASARAVREGMVASVQTGVAHAAFVPGVTLAGKTGTVDLRDTGRSEGWFAGVVYGAKGQPQQVLVVFVPNGNGRDAAALAARVLAG
jgi:cell division protein FtsI/penicillin-binding protein 2